MIICVSLRMERRIWKETKIMMNFIEKKEFSRKTTKRKSVQLESGEEAEIRSQPILEKKKYR